MALTKVNRGGLNTGISDSSDATFLTVDSSEQAVIKSEGGAVTTSVQQGLVKAWLHFNGSGTISITDSFNHASLTDHGTGDYSSVFTNNMNNANHATTGSTINGAGGPSSSNVGLVTIGEGNTTSLIGIGSVANTANANDRSKIYSQVTGDLA